METTLEQQIEKAHAAAERNEADARAIEARIIAAGGVPPRRQYGHPVNLADVRKNLTLTSILNRRDPALASFLGVQTGDYLRQAEQRQARMAAQQRIEQHTAALAQRNAEARQHREQCQRAGIDPITRRIRQ